MKWWLRDLAVRLGLRNRRTDPEHNRAVLHYFHNGEEGRDKGPDFHCAFAERAASFDEVAR